jgi:cell division protein FtsX
VVEPIADLSPTHDTEPGTTRRARFRSSVGRLAERSTSQDLVRWMLIPGSLLVLIGFVAIGLGWMGASETAREIEQMPYLISGGIIGLALVVLGGLLLVSTFWVAVLRKLQEEADQRAHATLADLADRVTELEQPARRTRRSRAS